MSQTQSHTVTPMATEPLNPMTTMSPAIADPGPLGLAAFAMTTFMLSVFNTNMLSATLAAGMLGLALFYGGTVQLLAGMWEFRNGNTFGALAFSSFGAFWLSYWYFADHIAANTAGHRVHKAMALSAGLDDLHRLHDDRQPATTGAIAAVFVALTLTFVFLAIGAFGDSESDDQGRRLARPDHRGGGLVRLPRRRHERHLKRGAPRPGPLTESRRRGMNGA